MFGDSHSPPTSAALRIRYRVGHSSDVVDAIAHAVAIRYDVSTEGEPAELTKHPSVDAPAAVEGP